VYVVQSIQYFDILNRSGVENECGRQAEKHSLGKCRASLYIARPTSVARWTHISSKSLSLSLEQGHYRSPRLE